MCGNIILHSQLRNHKKVGKVSICGIPHSEDKKVPTLLFTINIRTK